MDKVLLYGAVLTTNYYTELKTEIIKVEAELNKFGKYVVITTVNSTIKKFSFTPEEMNQFIIVNEQTKILFTDNQENAKKALSSELCVIKDNITDFLIRIRREESVIYENDVNVIYLKFESYNSDTQNRKRFTGEDFGEIIFESQILENYDSEKLNMVIFPQHIDVSISFCKGFLKRFNELINMKDINKRFRFTANNNVLTKIESILLINSYK